MIDRRVQLRALYGVDFPDELFAFWEWHQALDGELARAFHEVLGIGLHGPFDVLAGKFDDRELRYPAVLHWRYQYDPPELFTVMAGDTDGLHWGYWFDDPGRLPPVVASFYARDAFDLTEDASLFRAVATYLEANRRCNRENRTADRARAETYDRDLAALDALRARLPASPKPSARAPTVETADGMGIVVARELLAPWQRPAKIDRAAILAFVDAEIAAGRPGTALLVGRRLWDGAKDLAFDVLLRAYAALDREPLRAVAAAHREYPVLPSLDLLSYARGEYGDLGDALAHASDVRTLKLRGLETIEADLGALVELETLQLGGNRLSTLPASLARCTKLRSLNLYNNRFTTVPGCALELPALQALQLGSNQIVDIDDVARCRSLIELDLDSNKIVRLPDDIGNIVALRTLNLGGNAVRELPASVTALASLELLVLSGCPLTSLPADIRRWRALERLMIADTLLPADEFTRARAELPNVEIVGEPAAPSKPYSTTTTFTVGDTIAHLTFGVGTVRTLLADGKIEVRFREGVKTLLHGRA